MSRRVLSGLAASVMGACGTRRGARRGRRIDCPTPRCAAIATRVLTLIKQGADVNAPQGDGVTALHWAATRGDADWRTRWSPPARTCARRRGSVATRRCTSRPSAALRPSCRRWSKGGAESNARTNTGATPLMLAAGGRRHRDADARSSMAARSQRARNRARADAADVRGRGRSRGGREAAASRAAPIRRWRRS